MMIRSFQFLFFSRLLAQRGSLIRFGRIPVVSQFPFGENQNAVRLFHSSTSNFIEDTVVSRCEHKISQALKPKSIKVTSTNDDPNGSHIRVYCISEEFEGKSVVQRQRLIYKCIWEELNGPVHAVDSIVAKTPKEAAST